MTTEDGNERSMSSPDDQAKAVVDGLAAAFRKLNEPRTEADLIGAGTTYALKDPVVDSFGEFTTRKDYRLGVNPLDEIKYNGGVVVIQMVDDDTIRHVEIGRTPDKYNPSRGGKPIEGAGSPSEYLLALQRKDKRTGATAQSLRYLAEGALKGVVVKSGQDGVDLKPQITDLRALARGEARQIKIQGIVGRVSSLRK